MNKRIIASILTVIMLMTMLPTAAFAADGESTETGDSTTPEAAIYLDQQHGADDNDGLSKTTAVKTIEKANELANEKNIKDICLLSFYKSQGRKLGTWRKDTAPLWARRLYDRTRRCVCLADTE